MTESNGVATQLVAGSNEGAGGASSKSNSKMRSGLAGNQIGEAFGSLFEALRSPKILLPNFTAAVLLAVMNITTAISIAALVFSGPLIASFGNGIGIFLIGSVLGGVLVAAGSGYKAVLAGPRSGQAPIVASMAAGIALTMQGQPDEVIGATVIAAILSATVFIGVVLFIIGKAKLGGMARYIPYSVMGGFFAGLGFLLFKGGIFVSLGSLVDPSDLSSFANWKVLLHLAPAVGFAVLYYIAESRIKHWMLMPSFLVATVLLFYLVIFLTGHTIDDASADGWLPTIETGGGGFFPAFTFAQLQTVEWAAILPQISAILVMTLMSIIMVLLDTSGIEIVLERDIDPNHELKAAAWGQCHKWSSDGTAGSAGGR